MYILYTFAFKLFLKEAVVIIGIINTPIITTASFKNNLNANVYKIYIFNNYFIKQLHLNIFFIFSFPKSHRIVIYSKPHYLNCH
jgi:hypothetical protein